VLGETTWILAYILDSENIKKRLMISVILLSVRSSLKAGVFPSLLLGR
jgi:hypothetical protein